MPAQQPNKPEQRDNKGILSGLGSGKMGRAARAAALTAMLAGQSVDGLAAKQSSSKSGSSAPRTELAQNPSAREDPFVLGGAGDLEPDSNQSSDAAKRRQYDDAKRQEMRQRTAKSASTGGQIAGTGMRATEKIGVATSRSVGALSNVTGKAGDATIKGSRALMEAPYGLGIIPGAIGMGAGGIMKGAGAVGKEAAKVGESASRGIGKTGRAVSNFKTSPLDLKRQLNMLRLGKSQVDKSRGIIQKAMDMDTGTSPLFLLSICLAGLKDGYDLLTQYFDVGITGTILNFGITTAFVCILLLRGKTMGGMKRWARFGIVALAEFIPLISFLPFWTIGVMFDKWRKGK